MRLVCIIPANAGHPTKRFSDQPDTNQFQGLKMSSGTTSTSIMMNRHDPPISINDAVISIATANGTGSQSANLILTRSIFQMGVPVSAKNLFPSNIQGLPTWFSIRANRSGYTARRTDVDIMVCMNQRSVEDDFFDLKPGAVVLIRDELMGHVIRDDLNIISVPFSTMVKDVCPIAKIRKLVMNMLYVGVLAHLLKIELDEVNKAIDKQFARKPSAADLNRSAMEAAWNWAVEHIEMECPHRLERMNGTEGQILVEGNQAAALGSVWGGMTLMAWYPITPSSSLAEAAIDYLRAYRHDPDTGKATYAVIQAEDELAAISMVVGAGWAGARAMTTTAGPGISLMAELAGLSYFAEIPVVIVDVQRMGPSTGLPTRTCQGDIMKAYYLSHGDCRHICLLPGSARECFEMMAESFNLAERFQTLVFMLSDLDLGMNLWMSRPFEPINKPIHRGKVLDADDLEKMGGFNRYEDVDGDGIPYRTLPGTPHPSAAYFTRGTGHTSAATYSEKPEDWKSNMDRLNRKFETARKELPEPVIITHDHADIGIIAYGSSDPAVVEAGDILDQQHDITADYLRVKALPVHRQVYEFIIRHDRVFLIEQNRDAQLYSIMSSERPELMAAVDSVLHYDGMSIDAASIVRQVLEKLGSSMPNIRELI
jgi:2-oxoglutarate ferredoxin oxidoreductase subunit alpha